ncbi:MAG: hypothetical protein QXH37_06175 [Candidatus Bathyarchaeia archaeon]
MSEAERKKKKKKLSQLGVLKEVEQSQSLAELVGVLEELEKEGKFVEVQICPNCKSPKVRRVGTMSGDLWGHMGILPPKFECEECEWRARLVLKATNKPLNVKDLEIIAEASHSN